jgi:hypothetical protein
LASALGGSLKPLEDIYFIGLESCLIFTKKKKKKEEDEEELKKKKSLGAWLFITLSPKLASNGFGLIPKIQFKIKGEAFSVGELLSNVCSRL